MKNKTIKRMLSIGLALTMLTGMLTGCGDQATNANESSSQPENSSVAESTETSETSTTEAEPELEPVTLKWLVADPEHEGSDEVAEAFNKKLAEVLPNTTVEFEYSGNNWEYGNVWSPKIAAGEHMDIAWAGYSTNYLGDVQDGSILGISELIEQYAPNIQAEIETWPESYDSCTLDGEIYGIPSIQPSSGKNQTAGYDVEVLGPYIDQEALLAEYRKTPNTRLTQEILDIYEKAYEGAIADGLIEVGSDLKDSTE